MKANELGLGGRGQLNFARGCAYAFLLVMVCVSLFPFYVLLVNATRGHTDILRGFSALPGAFAAYNVKSMFANTIAPVLTGILNSLFVSAGSAACACYFSALTAYAIHAYDFRFRKFIFYFILAIMVIPTQVGAAGFVSLMRGMSLTDNFIPLIVPSIAAPAVFFFLKEYMENSLPVEIIDAARADGAREFAIFNRVALPMLKPAIAVQAIMTFVGAWNNYFIPALLIEKSSMKTMPIIIAGLRSADFVKFDMGSLYMTVAFAIVPIIVVYIVLSKYIVMGVAMGSVKG